MTSFDKLKNMNMCKRVSERTYECNPTREPCVNSKFPITLSCHPASRAEPAPRSIEKARVFARHGVDVRLAAVIAVAGGAVTTPAGPRENGKQSTMPAGTAALPGTPAIVFAIPNNAIVFVYLTPLHFLYKFRDIFLARASTHYVR